ncbi:hypothetical protein H6P81_000875 [Aristolochia fimbriata]|uniref:Uncharacterized protein n=1 Tax=Aristolochia fimbriata TaxID=158543 RepID=A0AAV7F5G5_ARIFI|nr:hypothetical protein H6P81_000875 [Aristolochia fimbriata]
MKVPKDVRVLNEINEVYPEEITDNHRAISLLEGQEVFLNRILSRDSSRGFSSRIYYRGVGEVPFKWEVQPGTPKVTQKPAMLPPLSPPPAILSSRLAQDRDTKPNAGLNRGALRFWKRKGKRCPASKNKISECPSETGSEADSAQLWSSEGDSPGSPTCSTSSSSSFSAGSPSPVSTLPEAAFRRKLEHPTKKTGFGRLNLLWGCNPWDFTGAMLGLYD